MRTRNLACLLVVVTVLAVAPSARADWSAISDKGQFVWGGDKEGGGPYIFSPKDDPNKTTGFEVDLAEAIAAKLNVQAKFSQRDWDVLLQNLDRGDVDLVLNGYELTPERAAEHRASIPYYIYELGLLAHKENPSITDWDDLMLATANGKRRRIGVLEGSAADSFVTERFGTQCDILRYKGSVESMGKVQTRELDATVQDLPVCQFYVEHGKDYPELRIVGQARAPGQYVIYARKDDAELIDRVNNAIRDLYQSGALRAIYEQYGIWNPTQQKLPQYWQGGGNVDDRAVLSRWTILERNWPLFWRAAMVTVMLSVVSMPLAIALGLVIALVRGSGPGSMLDGLLPTGRIIGTMLRGLMTLYVELIRGTPLAFQLFVVYFVLPQFGVRIDEFWAAVIALAVNYSAYEAEIFRLGLQAIPRGQMEAALALGMSPAQAIRRIILPQALRITIPATANDFIALFKDTAVCSVIAVEELSKIYSMQAKSTGLLLEMAVLTSLLYLAMSYPLSLFAGWLERKLSPDRRV